MNWKKMLPVFFCGVVAACLASLGCNKSSSMTSSGGGFTAGPLPTTGAGTAADATAAVNEQLAAEGVSSKISGLVQTAALLPNVTVSQTVNCAGGGTAALSGTWTNESNVPTGGIYYRTWNVNVTHTLTNCVRRGYTINGSFVQVMDNNASSDGSTYMYRQREVASPNLLYSSTGTFSLSGSSITVVGNSLPASAINSCAISGAVTFDREDTAQSATVSVNGTVTLCGQQQSVAVNKSVVTGL
jgi:hypothetical protein